MYLIVCILYMFSKLETSTVHNSKHYKLLKFDPSWLDFFAQKNFWTQWKVQMSIGDEDVCLSRQICISVDE